MANNRMFFTCPTCRCGVLIAKALGEWQEVYHDDLAERLSRFIQEHNHCGPAAKFTNGTRFVLTYETDEAPAEPMSDIEEAGEGI